MDFKNWVKYHDGKRMDIIGISIKTDLENIKKHMKISISANLVLTFLLIGCVANNVRVVDEGEAMSVVIISDEPSPMALYAAKEFVTHVKKATGVEISVTQESEISDDNLARIYIGVTNAARQNGINPETLGPDEFVLRTEGTHLFVLGNEDMNADPLDEIGHTYSGTLFGVYELLERFLEVRWLWPGELGTYIPSSKNFVIEPLNEVINPALQYRVFWHWDIQNALGWPADRVPGWLELEYEMNYPPEVKRMAFSKEGLLNYSKDLKVFMRRHRMGSERKPFTGHYFGPWWEQYGATHPEWFMMREDGERGPQPEYDRLKGNEAGFRSNVAMCVSNPELHRYIVEKAWDGGDLLRLGEVDSSVYCHCPVCMSWDGPQPEDAVARIISDRYARFWNTIYEMAVDQNPDVQISTFLYVNYFPAPLTDIKIYERIHGDFCPWSRFMVWYPATEERLEWQRQQWLGWAETGISLGYRPNHPKSGYALPHVNTWQGGEFIRFAYKNGLVGVSFDALSGQWAVKGPEHYMYFRLLVNPELTIEEIRNEYFSAFGPAAEHVERYFDYWEEYNFQLMHEERWHNIRFDPRRAPDQYPPKVFPSAEEMLADAMDSLRDQPDSEYAERVRFLQTGLEHGRLSVKFIDLMLNNHSGAKDALKELIQFRRNHEHMYISNYLYLATRGEVRYYGDEIERLIGIEEVNQ